MAGNFQISDTFAATGEDSGFIEVGNGHHLHYKRMGKRGGIPVIVLHGGPGGQMAPDMGLYDPAVYDVVFFSQRGCGESWRDGNPQKPDEGASPEDMRSYYLRKIENESGYNTIPHLIEDVEAVRHAFWPDKQVNVSGGSWGGSLAMLYAVYYPQHVDRLLLRATSLIELCGSMNPADKVATQRQFDKNIHFQRFYAKMEELDGRDFPFSEIMERLYYGHHDIGNRAWTDEQKWEASCAWRHWNQDLSFKGGAPESVHIAVDRDMERTLKIASIFSYYSEIEYPKFGPRFLEQNLPGLIGNIRVDFVHGFGDEICPLKNAMDAATWISGEDCTLDMLHAVGFWTSNDGKVRVFPTQTGHSEKDKGMGYVLKAVTEDWRGRDAALQDLYPALVPYVPVQDTAVLVVQQLQDGQAVRLL